MRSVICLFAVFAAAIAFSFFGAQNCWASWQYTNWNMTAADVQKASKGAAVVLSTAQGSKVATGDCIGKLTAPYAAGTFKFNADFLFSPDGKLCLVRLNLLSLDDAGKVNAALETKYGPPAETSKASFGSGKVWYLADDRITFYVTDYFAAITYSPRVTPENKGL